MLLLVAGRPLELGRFAERDPGDQMAWFPGTEGGPAVADVLFGDVSPSGKLPVSWPRTVGQLAAPLQPPADGPADPTTTTASPSVHGRGADAALSRSAGASSYARFAYSDVPIEKTDRPARRIRRRSASTLANSGGRPGQEVVQLYVRDPVASHAAGARAESLREDRPLAGRTQARHLAGARARALGFHRDDGTYLVEAGEIQLFVGGSSQAPPAGSIEIVGDLHILPGERKAAKRGSMN